MPYVNGIYMDAPGASVVINDQNFQGSPAVGGRGLILVGPATDGQPNTGLSIAGTTQANAILKGGDLLQGALNALSGASKVNGSINLTVIDPTPRTQATSSINNSSGTEQIALTTTSYGTLADDAKWMIQAGTTVGYNVNQGFDFSGPGGQTYPPNSASNVSLSVLSLAYTGSDTDPLVTISDTLFTVSATSGTTSVTLASITLSSTVTVQQLVNQLNQVSGLVASVLDPNASDATGALFDNVSSVALSTTSTAPTTFYANVTAVVRYFNNLNLYFTAVRQANATSLATSSVWTYASGGTTPTATNADWQNAYTTAQSITGAVVISPVSSSYTIWGYNDAHCHYMASIGQGRRGYVGDTSGQTEATEQAQASILNSNRTSIVWPEQAGVDYNGNSTTFAPYLEACAVAGERTAYTPYNALTEQPVPSNGMGQTLSPGQVSQGLSNGLCILAPDQSSVVVVQEDRTTWMQNTAYDKVQNSTGMVADIIISDLTSAMSKYVGKAATNLTVGQATATLFKRLNYWFSQNYIVVQPQLSDISLAINGTQLTGSVNAALAVPTNYIGLQLYPVALAA